MKFHIVLDFDGTISPIDTTDFLLERFAHPQWREIEREWRSGRIGSRECLSRQVALLRATPHAVHEALAYVTLDPDVARFVTEARMRGASVSVASDGFDLAILHLLRTHGIDVPVISNRLVPVGEDRWQAEFSNTSESCASGTCKCATLPPGRRVMVVGDGRSDFCIARRADMVLAKGDLIAFCAREGIPHLAISNFADALAALDSLFVQTGPAGRRDSRSCETTHA